MPVMRPITLRALSLLAVFTCCAPLPSLAAGVQLAWSHCVGDAGAIQNAAFACDTNSGTHVIVASFVLGAGMPTVIGTENVIELAAAAPTRPAWWDLRNEGTCRPSSLSHSLVPVSGDVACADWSAGLMAGGIGAYCVSGDQCVDFPGPNRARVKVFSAVAPQNAQDLVGGQSYFTFLLTIDHVKTVGAGACGGCDVPVCIVFNSVNVVDRGAFHQRFITGAASPGSDFITWQGGGPVGLQGCPAATSAQRSTWGSVKALYR